MDTIRLANGLITTNNYFFDFNTFDIYKIDDNQKTKLCNEQFSIIKNENYNEIQFQVLKINTVNYCNLRCKYCYANEGTYNKIKNAISTKEISMLSKLEPYLKDLKVITFFGGEPFLNPNAIEAICEKYKERDIVFLAQTNGTLFNERTINLIRKYNIRCTLSVDGNKQINDAFRVFKDGRGTFDTIYEGFEKVKEHIISIEGTRADFSIETNDIYKELYELFHIRSIKVVDDQGQMEHQSNKELKPYEDFNNLFDDIQKDTLASNLLVSFFSHHKSNFFCNAGNKTLHLDSDGKLYPCQLLIENQYELGNLYDFCQNDFEKKCYEFQNHIRKINCQSCYLKTICSHCYAHTIQMNEQNCNRKLKYADQIFEKTAELIEESKLQDLLNVLEKREVEV